MPVILKQNQYKFEIKKDLIIPNKVLKKTVTTEKVEQEEGDGIFSSLGMLAKSGIDLFAQNKELISNVAQGVGGVGSAAAAIAQAVKSSNELEQIKRIAEMRDKALKSERRKLSESAKQRLAEKLQSGSGFVKVE